MKLSPINTPCPEFLTNTNQKFSSTAPTDNLSGLTAQISGG